MKKKFIVWICIMSLLVSITGCNRNSNQQDSLPNQILEGEYIECVTTKPELQPGEVQFDVNINGNNQLQFYTVLFGNDTPDYQILCYTLIDGTYQKASLEWANKAVQDIGIYPTDFCYGQDGNEYILGFIPEQDSAKQLEERKISYAIIKKTTQGYENITPDYWSTMPDSEDNIIGLAVGRLDVTKDQLLCYQENYDGCLVFYDPVKGKKVELGEYEVGINYLVHENNVYTIGKKENDIEIYHLVSGTSDSINVDKISEQSFLQVSEEGNIILLDEGGIHEYKNGGTMWETILDGKQGSMSIPSYEVSCFLLRSGKTPVFYVLYNNKVENSEQLFVSYEFSENGTAENSIKPEVTATSQKELTIYSMWNNTTLRQTISEYTKLHPEININYVVAMTEDNSVTQSDLIRTLNTEILAGNGADIILMDGLPLDSYIQKGVLMDMSEIFSPMKEENLLVNNITDNYVREDKVYCMPMRFYMPIYAMAKDISSNTKTVEELAVYCKNTETSLMEELSYELLVQMFLYTYYDEILNEDGMLDNDKLMSFLNSMNDIANQIGAKKEGDYGISASEAGIQGANDRMRTIFCGAAHVPLLVNVESSITFMGDISDMISNLGCLKEMNGTFAPMNKTFVPNGLIGINSSTKEPELAKDLISFAFTEDMQALHLNDGFPVNDKALSSWIDLPDDVPEDASYGFTAWNKDNSIELTFVPATVEEKQTVGKALQTLTQPVFNDYIAMDMILEGAVAYLDGEKSLEQATSDIVERVNLYMKE